MAALSSNRDIVVGSDQDFSNGLILAYYAEAAASERKLVYVSSSAGGRRAPDWFISHSFDVPAAEVPVQLTNPAGETYTRVRSFTYGGLSGCNWFLYRRR
jgi:hypothetical protein